MQRLLDVTVDFAAGWTSGVVGLIIGHPLDTVKTRLQTSGNLRTMQCIVQTFREETFSGFYKGMAAPLVAAGFLHSTFFLGYSFALTCFEPPVKSETDNSRHKRAEHHLEHMCFASVAGAILQWVPGCPIDVVKIKLQVQRENLTRFTPITTHMLNTSGGQRILYTGVLDCVRKTISRSGIAGLYQGGCTMLLRDVVGYLFYVPVYELSVRFLKKHSERDSISRRYLAPMMAGGVAGVASWWSVLPLDVLKSRLQADDVVCGRYKGLYDCSQQIYKSDGIAGFFKGWQVAAIRGFPACACIFLVYEQTVQFLRTTQHSFVSGMH